MTDTTQVVEPEAKPAEVEQVSTEVIGTDGKPFDPERAQALIEKLREENKEAKAAKKKLAELEAAELKRKEAEMSELEKLQSQLKQQEAQLKEANLREMQRKAADKAKLPAEFVDRLRGETLEEMEADAMKLVAALPKQPTLTATNTSNNSATVTDQDRRNFLYRGGKLPGV